MLTALSGCTCMPTAEVLAALVSRDRADYQRQRYGLQLLWRLVGDERIADALTLFPAPSLPDSRTMEAIRADLLTSLKGGTP